MGEILGGIQRALGSGLGVLYSLTHSYAIAIILLTLILRALFIPLDLKRIRSMSAMAKLGPEQKKIQEKFKGIQKKARDRAEVQQIRMQMQQEIQALYKAHGVNPLGGCLPMLAQMPFLIAMFSVMRAAIPAIPLMASLVSGQPVTRATFEQKNLKSVVCRPVDSSTPSVTAADPHLISCPTSDDPKKPQTHFKIGKFVDVKGSSVDGQVGWIAACVPHEDTKDKNLVGFACRSSVGTGHLPKTSKLFSDLSLDHATVFGMHSGCTASQVSNVERAKQCTTDPSAGGTAKAIPYYLLVGLIVFTTYYSSKQMSKNAGSTGQMAQQQKTMTLVMPAVMGLISLSLPAGSNMYFFVTNLWAMGQQHLQFRNTQREGLDGERPARADAGPANPVVPPRPLPPAKGQGQNASKKRKKKKKKR